MVVKRRNKFYLTYQEHTTGGNISKGCENDEWPMYDDIITTVTIPSYIYYQQASPNNNFTTREIVGDFEPAKDVYLVAVRYCSGGTFGRVLGCVCFIGVFQTLAEALKAKAHIENKHYKGWSPWLGYFESLEGVEIHKLEVVRKNL